jgi:hypothetical protein
MAFSDQAIGFYLELDDRLTPALQKAERGYARYVKALDGYNKIAFRSTRNSMGELAKLVKSFDKLPKRAERGYKEAMKRIKKEAKKTIEQPLNLVLTSTAKKNLQKAVGEAVSNALAGSKLRLRASMPQRKLAMFSGDKSLRGAYKTIAQPPDMMGFIKPKGFAKGGLVEGGKVGKDSVPALLQPGEMVLPVKLVEFWNKTTQKATKGVAFISDKFKGFQKRMTKVNDETETFDENVGRMRNSMGRFVKGAPKDLKKVGDVIEDNDTKTLTWMATIAGVAQGFNDMGSNISSAFSEAEGGEGKGFIESMNELNQHLGLSRKELGLFKSATVDAASAGGAGLNEMGMAMTALAEAGVTNREEMLRLAPVVANMATATDADVGQLATTAYRLGDAHGYSADKIAQVMLATKNSAQATASSSADLMTQMEGQAKSMAPLLNKVTQDTGAAILANLGAVTGSLNENWGATGSAIADTMSQAMGGSQEAQKALGLMGMSTDDIQTRLASGDMNGMFNELAGTIQSMSGSDLTKLKEAMGFEDEVDAFANIGNNIDGINASLSKTGAGNMSTLVDPDAAVVLKNAADANKTTFDRLSESFTSLVSSTSAFGVRGDEVLEFFTEFNPMAVAATAHLLLMSAKGFGSVLMKLPLLGKGLGAIGSKISGVFGKKSPLTDKNSPLAGGASAGGGIKGMLKGLGSGLKFLGKGLAAFGKSMIGPGGLGLIMLTAGLIGIGFAIKLAAPLFEMLGKVISKMIDGFVEMFKTIATLDAKQMILIGPALVVTAGGVAVLAGAVGLLGIAMLGASVGVGAFRLATGGKGLASGGLASVVSDLVGGFQPLSKQAKHLEGINRVMNLLVDFMVDFAKLALVIGGLSIGASIATAVDSVLGFLGVDSPMEMLAKQGSQMASTIGQLVNDFASMAGVVPQMDIVATTMGGMLDFLKKYTALSEIMSELPSQGVFSNIVEGIGGFFGADSPIEKLAEDAGPILNTLAKLTTQFSEVQLAAGAATSVFGGIQAGGLTNMGAQVAVNDKQIQGVVTAVLERADESPLHGDLLENNRLLGEIATLLRRQVGAPAPVTVSGSSQPPRQSNPLINQMARGDF